MNSALSLVSFQSAPSLNLNKRPPSRSRHHEKQISANWGASVRHRQRCLPKQIRPAVLGSNATEANNAYPGVPLSPLTNLIQEFYSSINARDMARLKKLLDPDCVVEHALYYKPLDYKDTHAYFTRLMAAMKKNVNFTVDEVCEGVESSTATVMWHLEWNGKMIPYTKGCSFYTCSANGETLLIRKVHIFNEPPLKPGKMDLDIFQLVAEMFDAHPKDTEEFLQNPEALFQLIPKLYKSWVEPLIVYLLAYFIRFWWFVAQGLAMALGILNDMFKRLV